MQREQHQRNKGFRRQFFLFIVFLNVCLFCFVFFLLVLHYFYAFSSSMFCWSHLIFCCLCILRRHTLYPLILFFFHPCPSYCFGLSLTSVKAEQDKLLSRELWYSAGSAGRRRRGGETGVLLGFSWEIFWFVCGQLTCGSQPLSTKPFSLAMFDFYGRVLWVCVSIMTFDNVILYCSWWYIVVVVFLRLQMNGENNLSVAAWSHGEWLLVLLKASGSCCLLCDVAKGISAPTQA